MTFVNYKEHSMMRLAKTIVLGAIALCIGAGTLLAHELTYKGKVTKVEAAKIHVNVMDEKSKKEMPMDFTVTAKTKVLRGDRTVPFADAKIQKDERVSVTINNDADAQAAITIRLAPAK